MHIRQSQTWTPLAAINITPLIDVLIVILVLFIVIAPAQTHVLSAEVQTSVPFGDLSPPMNRVHITADDRILWNGTAVSEVELRTIAAHAAGTSPEPELRLSADPQAGYAAALRVTNLLRRSGASQVRIDNLAIEPFRSAPSEANPLRP